MPPPSTGIPVPTGSLDSYRAQLKLLQKESKAVARDMARDAKKGVDISKELIDRKKKIDKALKEQQDQLKRVETHIARKQINQTAADSRAGNTTSAWSKSAQGVMLMHHVLREIKKFDESFKKLKGGGPLLDKEEGVGDLLSAASHIPGPIGIAARGLNMALHAVMAIQRQIKEDERGQFEVNRALHGGPQFIDPDDVKRRERDAVSTKLSYVDPQLALHAPQIGNVLGGKIDGEAMREDLARQIRVENAGMMRTIMQGLPLIGGFAQKGGKIWGIDDEAKVNALIDSALNSKIPELMRRSKASAEMGDFASANADIAEIRKIKPELAPTDAEGLFKAAEDHRLWATRKSIEQMGIRHIEGRDE